MLCRQGADLGMQRQVGTRIAGMSGQDDHSLPRIFLERERGVAAESGREQAKKCWQGVNCRIFSQHLRGGEFYQLDR